MSSGEPAGIRCLVTVIFYGWREALSARHNVASRMVFLCISQHNRSVHARRLASMKSGSFYFWRNVGVILMAWAALFFGEKYNGIRAA